MSKRICIIGGAGFVGRTIARQAIEAGHQVTVTTRHPARARDLRVKGIQVMKADIVSGKGLSTAIQDKDCVINLVGLLFESGNNSFQGAHVDGTKHIIAACKAAGVPQLLHMGALLDNKSIENSEYARTKFEAAALVQSSDLEWSIFHPSIIFGSGDSFLTRFKGLSCAGSVLPVISGDTKFQPVWVEDVARAFVLSIGNQNAAKQSFTLAGDKVYTFKELLGLWMSALDRDRILLPVPSIVASILAIISKLLPTPIITTDQLELLKYDNVAQGESFPAQFGETTSFSSLLPALACGGQATQLQQRLDKARTHYRKS
jgi:uncharacterized protein YbjT (DUF2867 family)